MGGDPTHRLVPLYMYEYSYQYNTYRMGLAKITRKSHIVSKEFLKVVPQLNKGKQCECEGNQWVVGN